MTDDPRVENLLEHLLESGETPEEVCRSCPELLPQVRTGLQRLRLLENEVGAMFPPSTAEDRVTLGTESSAELPRLRGYEVQEELGRGGVGVVYRAWQPRLNRPVALKMLLAGRYAGAAELERFLREAETVAAIRHPNIVQLYDAGDLDGRPYFTMEFVEGGSLAQKIGGAPQPSSASAKLLATVAEAVHGAHQAGLVHRDLKPANILLTADGTPKITDFGLARRLDQGGGLTLSGVPVGTPSYMAPEQARGQKDAIGRATDVYALGAILYELLTGRPPFRADTPTATLQQVLTEEPVPPARLNARVPRDLQTICLKCLNKEPKRRYATAAALAEDLRRFERGEPIVARPVGRLERAAKWVRRRPASAALLASGLLMLAGVIAAAVWYVGDRARLQYEKEWHAAQVYREANNALDQAEQQLKDLRTQLDDPLQVRELLSDIDRWQSKLKNSKLAWQRAVSVCAGNEALVAEETQARIQAVQATLSAEEDGYRLAKELDDIATDELTKDGHVLTSTAAMTAYAAFFAGQGVDLAKADKARWATVIKSSPIRFALLAGLDNWAGVTAIAKPLGPQLARVLELARKADPEPWRDRFRDPGVWFNGAALAGLAAEVDVERQPPMILVCLGRRLDVNGGDATALYKKAILCQPRDFWLHFNAAFTAKEPGLQVGLYHAALAIRPNSAATYGNLSLALRNQGDAHGAVNAAKKALTIKPNFVGGYNHLGLALGDSQDLLGAIAAFKKAIELDPKFAPAYNNLALALSANQDLPGAIAALKKAAELTPKEVLVYNNLGQLLGKSQDLSGAAAALKKVIELDPKFAPAQNNLGLVLRASQDVPGAIAAFKKAIELDPKMASAHSNLGLALTETQDVPGAIAAFKKAVELNPKFALAHNQLGLVLRASKDLPGAIAAFKKAIELDPNDAEYHANLGIALIAQGNMPAAIDALKKATELNAKTAELYYYLGHALHSHKDAAGAIAAFKKAIELAPTDAKVHSYLGVALCHTKNWPGAVAAFKKAIELEPGNFKAYHPFGMALQAQHQYAPAEQAYLKAIKAQPSFAPAYNSLAWLLATCPDDMIRDGKRAIEYATTSCQLTKWKNAQYLDTLAAAYAEAGQFDEAIRQQEGALRDPSFEARFGPDARQRLELYQQKKPFRDK